ncbi:MULTISPECIES: HAD family hydrolase [unclassified Acinetobacter]|uniref:HAD family hydrolase n=1 Tax=unclassified Acinetobacter TaxID=196816 RepID=UPI002934CF03|nr:MULTISPECIES: HAD family hydrolase [unclassified Acinetobacter]WOE32020.1 HAD family hydrolase [Acinetobacter sp. SAAs470]WOE37488.1 HAD family hydrolase [Acinetobacter sp. SAAs474]
MYEKSQTHKNLALFDFDGTLCNKDSFTLFFFYALSKRHIIKRGIATLPWIIGYYAQLYPAHLMRPKLFQKMLKHIPIAILDPIAKEYANYLIEHHLNPQLYQQLKNHQALGDDVVLVSASIDIYLQYIAQNLDIDLICSTTEIKNQYYTGRFASPDCSHQQKKIRVLAKYNLAKYQAIYAYGNSHEDLAMLSLAHFPYLHGKCPLPLPDIN